MYIVRRWQWKRAVGHREDFLHSLPLFLGTGQTDILTTALALPQSLAMARRGDKSNGEEMIPASFLVTLSAEYLPGNWKKTSKSCGLPECPEKGPSPVTIASLFPFQNYREQKVPKTNLSRAYYPHGLCPKAYFH